MREQFMPLGRQLDAARVAFKQFDAQIGLQRGDTLRDRGLCRVELVGCGAKAAQCGNPEKSFDIA
ncbi:hypothetical protein D3C72_1859170 [compost metagenome]